MSDQQIADWEQRVVQWARDRNILDGGTVDGQLTKLFEELSELEIAIHEEDEEGIKDSIGDPSVVLCIIAAMRGMSFVDCLEHAWNEIKDRKGMMVDGVFVKDET